MVGLRKSMEKITTDSLIDIVLVTYIIITMDPVV